MPSDTELLASIRRWLRVAALLLGLAVFEIASVAEGVNSYTTAAPASKLLAAVVVCVAAYALVFRDSAFFSGRPSDEDGTATGGDGE
jgi:hypothetical protein